MRSCIRLNTRKRQVVRFQPGIGYEESTSGIGRFFMEKF
ncbi:hypothetical protein ASZ90_009525 [hydrocarbon metagenome]|uniref:Uncharacterized protein n=1 Tax=hydrocarbon metagenome TaxID=938273 RepID=A0A0W8FII5_9ZZZZ